MKKKDNNAQKEKGLTVIELLVACAVFILVAGLVALRVRYVLHRSKVSAAKATINGFSVCLGMIKDDTGLYPGELSDVHSIGAPSGFQDRYWLGPYGVTLSIMDPWGNPYYYGLQDNVFGPEEFIRETGGPLEETRTFTAPPGRGTIIIQNSGVTSGSITLNGEEIVSENEFQQQIPVIVKEVDLLASNTLTIRLTGQPGITIEINISASSLSKDFTYSLLSKGRDGEFGGSRFDADIVYGSF